MKEENNAVLKKECHSRKWVSGIPTTFNNTQGGDPRLQASGMTTNLNNTPTGPTGILSRKERAAFTLIELLVVVLIIGILAAIALPQYQRAVYRSRNSELKQLVRSIAQAEEVYYMEHGKYAANFNELDVDLPLTVQKTNSHLAGACNTGVRGTDSARFGKDFYVALNSTDANMPHVTVVAYFSSGPYKCAGFGVGFRNNVRTAELHCKEAVNTSFYKAGQGSFCEKIEYANYAGTPDGYWRLYTW